MNVNRSIFNLLLLLSFASGAHAQAPETQERLGACEADSAACEATSASLPADSAACAPDTISLLADSLISAAPATTRYDRKIARYQKRWATLVPKKTSLQFAGDIGLYSLGFGWEYGKKKWETYFLVGYVPKQETRNACLTLTLKELYSPWRVALGRHVSVCPLFATLMLNTIADDEFWVREPERYPKGYYGFSSKVRLHLGVGQKFIFHVSKRRRRWFKEVAVFYELSTCELYLRQKVLNKTIPFKDIVCAGIGVQYTIF